jgi:lipopolysaccharide assembly outer membrane protein LptD (OstA)
MSHRCAVFVLFLLLACGAFAQTVADPPLPGNPGDPAGARILSELSPLERKTLAFDIAISTWYELRDMSLRFGLPAEGPSEGLQDALYRFFGLTPPQPKGGASAVTIETASGVEYFTMDETSDKLLKLTGPLQVNIVTRDDIRHSLEAESILINSKTNQIVAEGKVRYRRDAAGRSDEFTGASITIDLDSFSGIFMDGAYNLEPADAAQRTMTFRFESLAKRDSRISMLENATVTACDEPEPHYHIKAKKVWLLENGDWALSGATLLIGDIPVLWLPFFYYPSDEILFHPVFGFRAREGAYVQTTTYLTGEKQKEKDSSSSLSLFGQYDDRSATKRSGIFLTRTGTASDEARAEGQNPPAAKTPAGTEQLRLLVDLYSSLGFFAGLAGTFPHSEGGSLDFSVGLGASRSLFLQANGTYSPWDYYSGYESVWNASSLAGLELPFRYGASLAWTWKNQGSPLRISASIEAPVYSDPFFEQDFYLRAESTNLLSSLEGNKDSIAKRSIMTQNFKSSLSWSQTPGKGLAFLESLNVSKFGSQMNWRSRAQSTTGLGLAERRLLAASPQREFFYPDTLKLLDGSMTLSGSLLEFDSSRRSKTDMAAAPSEANKALRNWSKVSGSLKWTATGTANVEEKFNSTNWTSPDKVDGSLSYFLLGWRGTGSVSSSTSWADQFLTLQTSVGMSAQDQARPYLLDERTNPTSVHPYLLSDYSYRSSNLDGNLSLSLAPFTSGSPFSSSSLKYTVAGLLYRTRYAGLSGSGSSATPLYEDTWLGWNTDTITGHSIAATLGFAVSKTVSTRLGLSATLPPLLDKYSATLSLDSRYFRASLAGAMARAAAEKPLEASALTAQLAAGAAPYPVLRSDFSWDFVSDAPYSSLTSLEYGWARTSFSARKSKGYRLSGGLWSIDGSEYFRPFEYSLSLSPKFTKDSERMEKGVAMLRSSFGSTLSYTQNLVRFTESAIALGIDFSITSSSGTSFSLASSSANKSAWRYWPGLYPEYPGFDPADYGRDLVTDLVDSLSIWNSTALKRSLFKLQSLSMKLAQDLHDWTLDASLGMSPVLVTPDSGRPYYELDFSFTLAVAWKDIPELKSRLSYSKGEFGE